MSDETDGQKEVKELQNRILNLETELKKFQGKDSKETEANIAKVKALQEELDALRRERDDLKAKIWDRKERRAKERRNLPPAPGRQDDREESAAGGPFA